MNKEITILGMDIGGANTKAAVIKLKNNQILNSASYIEYFPFWEQSIREIPNLFKNILTSFLNLNSYKLEDLEYIAVAITAELSDAFQTKREGLNKIIDALEIVFPYNKLFYINQLGEFLNSNDVRNDILSTAAANWVSSALFLGHYAPNCIFIDAGSTTIDLIPILEGKPVTIGKTDISRLLNHELIYTGGLRATIPSITHFVPYKGNRVRIPFEKFALISDIHRVLNHISEKEYINDTADNRSKSIDDCFSRLARILCLDRETISREELLPVADFIYQQQKEMVKEELQLFFSNLKNRYPRFNENSLFILTGLSAAFLIKPVLKELNLNNVQTYESITNIPDHISSSAIAVAGALNLQLSLEKEHYE